MKANNKYLDDLDEAKSSKKYRMDFFWLPLTYTVEQWQKTANLKKIWMVRNQLGQDHANIWQKWC